MSKDMNIIAAQSLMSDVENKARLLDPSEITDEQRVPRAQALALISISESLDAIASTM